MATPRKPTVPTTDGIDRFRAQFDDLFARRTARRAFRYYLIGLSAATTPGPSPYTLPTLSLDPDQPLPAKLVARATTVRTDGPLGLVAALPGPVIAFLGRQEGLRPVVMMRENDCGDIGSVAP